MRTADILCRLAASRSQFLEFVERRVGSRAVAEDILQDAFARSIDKIGALEDEEAAVAWFYRVLRNSVVDQFRQRACAGHHLEAFAAEREHEVQPAHEVGRQVCRCVGQVAATLKPEYVEALRRVEVDGVAVKDFAAEANVSASAAAVRVFRARQALRSQVSLLCGPCAADGCSDCTCAGSGPCDGVHHRRG